MAFIEPHSLICV